MIDINPVVTEERVEPVEDDGDDHLTDGTPCWCMPTYETLACGAVLIIHNDREDWS